MGKAQKVKYLSIPCPTCLAKVKELCTDEYGGKIGTHDARRRAWKRIFQAALNN